MATYDTPGVYVEEVPSALMPIAGVSTSTVGFVGVVGDVTMPVRPSVDGTVTRYPVANAGTPVFVDSWTAFTNAFGEIQAGNRMLALAVSGFFDNGGGRCWVTAVAPGDAVRKLNTERARLAGERTKLDERQGAELTSAERTKLDEELKKWSEATAKVERDQDKLIDGLGASVTTALRSFDAIDEISLIVVPGATGEVRNAVVTYCANRKDTFAVLDGSRVADLTKKAIQISTTDSDYAAIYYPWIEASWAEASWSGAGADPTLVARRGFVPPSGHIAGIYARVDQERGVHKAPANEVIRGALGVETLVSKQGQGQLNLDGVNVIRKFGNNVTVWGARTMAGRAKPEWTYVSSRRLFIYLKESIEAGTQWVVFEPNSADLWSKIRLNVGAFLNTVWASGALMGATPEQAYYVRCDETTNTQDVRDLGRVVIKVGVALVKPAEFVVFQISQWTGPGQ